MVKRFNRIGSEGLKEHSVEGETLKFDTMDFEEFRNDIDSYLDSKNEKHEGKVRFI